MAAVGPQVSVTKSRAWSQVTDLRGSESGQQQKPHWKHIRITFTC